MTVDTLNSYSYYNLGMNTSSGINIPDFQIENGMSLEDLFSNEETAASSALNSGESAMSLEDMQTSMIQQGPRNGPPPPPQSDDMLSSIIDSDEDELWSVDELTDFSEALISTMQTSFDVSEIMDQYDTDGDGTIDASERVAMKEDNAFNLSPPDRDLVNPTDATSNLENISSLYLQNALEAYDFSSNYQNNMTLTFSMSQA